MATGTRAHRRGRGRGVAAGVLAAMAAAALSAGPAAAGTQSPPDKAQPPAPGEGPHASDPSDPPPSGPADAPVARMEATGTTAPVPGIERIGGGGAVATALAASQAGWPTGAAAAVIANVEGSFDSLAATTLAGAAGGPLLFTPASEMDLAVRAELVRLAPRTVYVVGGVSDEAVALLRGDGHTVTVVRGDERYETSYEIARAAVAAGADASTVIVATGESQSDAVTAAAVAAGLRHPLVLSPPAGFEGFIAERVRSLGPSRTLVVGGRAALPDTAVAAFPGVVRTAGSNRAATAVALADLARAEGLTGRPALVGDRWSDGLVAGVLAGHARRGPLLVTMGVELPPSVPDFLARHGLADLTIVDSGGAIDPIADCQLSTGDSRSLLCIEQELARQGYNVGAVDGSFDGRTPWALYAFQKVARLRPTGAFTEADWQAMVTRPTMQVRRPDLPPDHLEIDIARQLVLLVVGGRVAHVFHTSTGKASTPTIRGVFSVYEKRNYRQANRMYRPVFFIRGYAVHGYPEIPLYPASAGCARVQDADMDFLFPRLTLGMRVATY